jgi:hypothetical protein
MTIGTCFAVALIILAVISSKEQYGDAKRELRHRPYHPMSS